MPQPTDPDELQELAAKLQAAENSASVLSARGAAKTAGKLAAGMVSGGFGMPAGVFHCLDCDGKVSFAVEGTCPHCGARRPRGRLLSSLRASGVSVEPVLSAEQQVRKEKIERILFGILWSFLAILIVLGVMKNL